MKEKYKYITFFIMIFLASNTAMATSTNQWKSFITGKWTVVIEDTRTDYAKALMHYDRNGRFKKVIERHYPGLDFMKPTFSYFMGQWSVREIGNNKVTITLKYDIRKYGTTNSDLKIVNRNKLYFIHGGGYQNRIN